MSYTDIAAGVTFFSKFASEELVKFSTEDTVCDKLSLFADLSGHLEDCSKVISLNLWSFMKSSKVFDADPAK